MEASGPTYEQGDKINKVAELLESSGIGPDEISRIDKVRIGSYQMLAKVRQEDGSESLETRDLEVASLVYTPQSEEVTEQAFISQAAPTIIRPAKVKRLRRKTQTLADLPDIQFGWRKHEDGTLEPIHDPKAMNVALQITKDLQPDEILVGGDNLDLPEFSRFPHDSNHFAEVTQAALDGLHLYLASLRSNNPNARIRMLAGNHDQRLIKRVIDRLPQMLGVRRANLPDTWPVLTMPYLLRLDEMAIEWVSGYPANEIAINDRLSAIHGDTVSSNGSTALKYAKERDRSVIFHHIHRHEMHTRMSHLGRMVTAASFGTLARVDGAVPSFGSGVDDRGNVVRRFENWQNGMGVVEYRKGDKPFQLSPVFIDPGEDYETTFAGKTYAPSGEALYEH